MKLYAHEIDVVILTPETADIVGVLSSSLSLSLEFSTQDEAMDVARPAPQEAHYHSDVVYLLLMVLRVRPTGTRFSTNSLSSPVDNTRLHSIPSVCCRFIKEFNSNLTIA